MAREKVCGIYKITNLINGKVYIGQSNDIEDRWRDHKWISTQENKIEYSYPLYRAFRKYGLENFSFEVIEQCPEEDLNEKEIYYIEFYRAYFHYENSNGYNQTLGGEGTRGKKISDETREKIRISCTGRKSSRTKTVISEGKTFRNAEECANYYGISKGTLKQWLTGRYCMPLEWYEKGLRYEEKSMEDYEIRNKILVICDDKIFNSIKECANYYNVSYNAMVSWLNKTEAMPQQFFDMKLHFKKDNFENCNYKIQQGIKKIECENMIFESLKECAEYYNIKESTMRSWLNHSNKMPKTFYDLGLHYKDEPMENYEVQTKGLKYYKE